MTLFNEYEKNDEIILKYFQKFKTKTLFIDFKNRWRKAKSRIYIKKYKKETGCYLTKETDQNELMSKKHKKFYTTLSYIEQFLILDSSVTGCISTSDFSSFLGISIGIPSYVAGICPIIAVIKKLYVNN